MDRLPQTPSDSRTFRSVAGSVHCAMNIRDPFAITRTARADGSESNTIRSIWTRSPRRSTTSSQTQVVAKVDQLALDLSVLRGGKVKCVSRVRAFANTRSARVDASMRARRRGAGRSQSSADSTPRCHRSARRRNRRPGTQTVRRAGQSPRRTR
jgi:hypothetical protein